MYEHSIVGWGTWIGLVLVVSSLKNSIREFWVSADAWQANAAAFVLAVGVPIFNYLIGIAASLFAAWFT